MVVVCGVDVILFIQHQSNSPKLKNFIQVNSNPVIDYRIFKDFKDRVIIMQDWIPASKIHQGFFLDLSSGKFLWQSFAPVPSRFNQLVEYSDLNTDLKYFISFHKYKHIKKASNKVKTLLLASLYACSYLKAWQ